MIRVDRQISLLLLVGCLFLLPALASPLTVAHQALHAHHKASTHSSAFCTWFCGVGQASNVTDSIIVPTVGLVATVVIESSTAVDSAVIVPSVSRGPPLHF